MMCSHPFFFSREHGKITFPNLPGWYDLTNGNVDRGMCHFSSKAVNVIVNLFPTPLTPNLSPIWAVGIKELWWRYWVEAPGIWVLLEEESTPTLSTSHWETNLCYVKPLKYEGLFGTICGGLKMATHFLTLLSLRAGSLSPVLESGLDCDCLINGMFALNAPSQNVATMPWETSATWKHSSNCPSS